MLYTIFIQIIKVFWKTEMLRKVPLIVILGSTGTGKTKLSIELSRQFNGEIISADSMQVYKGLNIATAKATIDEQSQAPHHMLDIASPNEPFFVTHFRDLALPIIDNLLQNSKVPIIVGGTNYYIESVLWQNLIPSDIKKRKLEDYAMPLLEGFDKEVKDFINEPTMIAVMDKMESTQLYEYLKVIDPQTAYKLHPNNKRKIMRAIEAFKDYGRRLSEIIEDQRRLPGASNLGGPSRYSNVIIFWLQCQQHILNQRLDARVDTMVNDGLLTEIRVFYDKFIASQTTTKKEIDYEEGIYQTIGFKEFIPYLESHDKSQDSLIEEYAKSTERESLNEPTGWKKLNACLEELKLVTKRYSKKQLKWIRNRFLGSETRQVPLVYTLDTSDVKQWNENVFKPAGDAVNSYINGEPVRLKPMDNLKRLGDGLNEETSHYCETCERIFIGDYQWDLHKKSNKHKHKCASKKRQEKLKHHQTDRRLLS